ncbi:2-oxoglutarate (2OG) and Fe(II)-dependent oxygenase superfamily protein, partial [Thalictrum thalictroides]
MTNHGVPEEIIEKMKSDTMEFFNLPLEVKKAYGQIPNHMEGYGQAFVMSEEQKLDWGDMHYLIANPLIARDMRFWPKTPTSFRETMEKYTKELRKVTINLIDLMAKNLGLEPEKLTKLFEDGIQGVRMNYYPPCRHADKVLGISPHSDATGLTLLIQVNEVQGLQVKKNGKWVPIKPIPGAFVVNIGDVLE